MNAHVLNFGEQVLVTGTQAIDDAIKYALSQSKRLSTYFDDPLDDDETRDRIKELIPRVVQGCIVPARNSEHAWWWREGDGGGRVKAVVFE